MNMDYFDFFAANDGFEQKDMPALGRIYDAMTHNGFCISEADQNPVRLELKDVLMTKDAQRFIPRVVQYIVREAIEPNLLIIPNLFQEVRMEAGRMIEIGAIGSIHAEEVVEGGEYKERSPDLDGGDMVAVSVKKHGLKISVTDEVIQDSEWDVINLWLRAAGRALARHKEKRGLQLFNSMGITVFNNDQSGNDNGEIGSLTGRGIDGKKNGTMSLNDIFDMYTYLVLRGFTPDTIMMHPLSWKMFSVDPEVREIVLRGATLASRGLPNGGPSQTWMTGHGGMGLRTAGTGYQGNESGRTTGAGTQLPAPSPWVTTLNPLTATFSVAPKGLPSPITVLVSPHVPFEASAGGIGKPAASVIMADSSSAGILVVRDPVNTEEFDDPARDIRSLKIRERWGMALVEQGKSIAVAKNVVVDRNYVFDNVHQVSLAEIDQSTTAPTGASWT